MLRQGPQALDAAPAQAGLQPLHEPLPVLILLGRVGEGGLMGEQVLGGDMEGLGRLAGQSESNDRGGQGGVVQTLPEQGEQSGGIAAAVVCLQGDASGRAPAVEKIEL
jgi:hypothetical protein